MRSLKMTGDLDARTDEGEWRVTSTLIVLADHFPAWTQLLRAEEVCELWVGVYRLSINSFGLIGVTCRIACAVAN